MLREISDRVESATEYTPAIVSTVWSWEDPGALKIAKALAIVSVVGPLFVVVTTVEMAWEVFLWLVLPAKTFREVKPEPPDF